MDVDSIHEIKRHLLLEKRSKKSKRKKGKKRKAMKNLDSILKSRDITLPTKVCIAKAMVFPIVMYGSERWTIRKAECQTIDASGLWCWRRLLRCPWTVRRSNQFKGNQPWILTGRTDAEAEAPILQPPDAKCRLIGKRLCWERLKAKKGAAGDEIVWQYHWLNGREFERTTEAIGGQRSLACCNPRGRRESDMT